MDSIPQRRAIEVMGEDRVRSDDQRAGNTIAAFGLRDSNIARDKTTDGCKYSALITEEKVEEIDPFW